MNLDLEESKKAIQKLRGEYLHLGFVNNDNNAEMSGYIVDQAIKLTNNMKKFIQEENEEFGQIKTQINALVQERIKVQQETIIIENRIYETEKDLGYK